MNNENGGEWFRTDGTELIKSASSIPDPDPSRFKQMESERVKNTWENILATDPRLRDPLTEIDSILSENNYGLEAHIGGKDYLEVANGETESPENLQLRIDEYPETLQARIENHFFENISEEGKLYQVQDTPIAFELRDLFPESIPLETSTDYLDLHAPTKQSFFNINYSESLQDHDAYDHTNSQLGTSYGKADSAGKF